MENSLLICLGWEEKEILYPEYEQGQNVFYNLHKIIIKTNGKKCLLIILLYED
jgi:hypothetical protein